MLAADPRRLSPNRSPLLHLILCIGLGLAASGCGAVFPADEDDDQVLASHPAHTPTDGEFAEREANDTFESANTVLEVNDFRLRGELAGGSSSMDQDVYMLTYGNTGDRIYATLTRNAGTDVVLGIYDDKQDLLAYVDPGSLISGPNEIDLILRENTTRLYAVVGSRTLSYDDRPYIVDFTIDRGDAVLGYQPQTLVLQFDGAKDVRIGNRAPVDVPAFNAANLGTAFANQTNNLINLIVDMVQEDYAGLDVAIYASGDYGIPDQNVTSIYFGTYDPQLLGLADNIDPFNADTTQCAIVFTDTFAIFNVFNPSIEEMAQVLANVASHEAGHLLGLRHTSDVHDLMDITASAQQMLTDQWFRDAVLHESVIPMGKQNAPDLLAWTLGGFLKVDTNARVAEPHAQAELQGPDDFFVPHGLLAVSAGPHDDPLTPEVVDVLLTKHSTH